MDVDDCHSERPTRKPALAGQIPGNLDQKPDSQQRRGQSEKKAGAILDLDQGESTDPLIQRDNGRILKHGASLFDAIASPEQAQFFPEIPGESADTERRDASKPHILNVISQSRNKKTVWLISALWRFSPSNVSEEKNESQTMATWNYVGCTPRFTNFLSRVWF